MAVANPYGQATDDPVQRVRRRIMGQMDPTDPSSDTGSASSVAAAPFAPQSATPLSEEPRAPEGMGGSPYFNGVTWISGGQANAQLGGGTLSSPPADTVITTPGDVIAPPAPPPSLTPPTIAPPNPVAVEPPAPGYIGPPGYQPPPPGGGIIKGTPVQPEGADVNSAIRQRLRPQIGQTRTFRNGRVGRFDGKGWVHAGG